MDLEVLELEDIKEEIRSIRQYVRAVREENILWEIESREARRRNRKLTAHSRFMSQRQQAIRDERTRLMWKWGNSDPVAVMQVLKIMAKPQWSKRYVAHTGTYKKFLSFMKGHDIEIKHVKMYLHEQVYFALTDEWPVIAFKLYVEGSHVRV